MKETVYQDEDIVKMKSEEELEIFFTQIPWKKTDSETKKLENRIFIDIKNDIESKIKIES